jgi:hypothetical protein
MRTWFVLLFAIVLVLAACQPITPEGSAPVEQPPRTESVDVASSDTAATPPPDASVSTATLEPDAVEATAEVAPTELAPTELAPTGEFTPTQSATTAENVAPIETPQTAGTATDTASNSESDTAPETPNEEPEPPAELVAFGYETYRKQYCGICHTLEAAGTTGTFGPPHDHIGSIAATRILEPNYSGSATNAAEYLHESLVLPEIFIVSGYALSSHRMPAYSFLSDGELDALVAFLLTQK